MSRGQTCSTIWYPFRWMIYAQNIAGSVEYGGTWYFQPDSGVTNASCITFLDSCGRFYSEVGFGDWAGWTYPLDLALPVALSRLGGPCHNEGLNFAFYDGHVKWLGQTFVRDYLPQP